MITSASNQRATTAPPVLVDGRYRLDRLVAVRPGFEDWKATDERLGRPVTLRLIRTATARQREDLVSAAGRLSRLDDDRLARVLDLDGSAETAFVVTEWTPGCTLLELLTADPVEPGLAIELIAEAATALATAAGAGLHHLCVTAESIIRLDTGHVKVLGTGLDAPLHGRASAHVDEDPAGGARVDTRALGQLLRRAVRSGTIDRGLRNVIRRATGEHRDPIRTPAELADALEPYRDKESALRRRPVRPEPVDAPHRLAGRRVRDLMATGVVTVSEDTPVLELAAILARAQCSVVPVVDHSGHVTGLISSTELARWRLEVASA